MTFTARRRDAKVAEAAVDAGASIVNDISAGAFDQVLLETVARLRNPRWLAQLSLYLLGSLAAQVKPSVGGKLVAVAVKT